MRIVAGTGIGVVGVHHQVGFDEAGGYGDADAFFGDAAVFAFGDDPCGDGVGCVVRHQVSALTGGWCWPVSPARIPACNWGCTAWVRSCATALASLRTVSSSAVTRSSSTAGVRAAPLACALGWAARAVMIGWLPFVLAAGCGDVGPGLDVVPGGVVAAVVDGHDTPVFVVVAGDDVGAHSGGHGGC